MSENDITKADREATAKSVIEREAEIMKGMEKNAHDKKNAQVQKCLYCHYEKMCDKDKPNKYCFRPNKLIKMINNVEVDNVCPGCDSNLGFYEFVNGTDIIRICEICNHSDRIKIPKKEQKCLNCSEVVNTYLSQGLYACIWCGELFTEETIKIGNRKLKQQNKLAEVLGLDDWDNEFDKVWNKNKYGKRQPSLKELFGEENEQESGDLRIRKIDGKLYLIEGDKRTEIESSPTKFLTEKYLVKRQPDEFNLGNYVCSKLLCVCSDRKYCKGCDYLNKKQLNLNDIQRYDWKVSEYIKGKDVFCKFDEGRWISVEDCNAKLCDLVVENKREFVLQCMEKFTKIENHHGQTILEYVIDEFIEQRLKLKVEG